MWRWRDAKHINAILTLHGATPSSHQKRLKFKKNDNRLKLKFDYIDIQTRNEKKHKGSKTIFL